MPDAMFNDVERFEYHMFFSSKLTLNYGPDLFIGVHAGGELESYGGSLQGLWCQESRNSATGPLGASVDCTLRTSHESKWARSTPGAGQRAPTRVDWSR